MHGAALASGATGLLAVQLRHDDLGVHAAGQRVSVIPVGCQHVVLLQVQGGHGSHRHRLLADIQMAEAPDLAQPVHLGGFFLQAPDQ